MERAAPRDQPWEGRYSAAERTLLQVPRPERTGHWGPGVQKGHWPGGGGRGRVGGGLEDEQKAGGELRLGRRDPVLRRGAGEGEQDVR